MLVQHSFLLKRCLHSKNLKRLLWQQKHAASLVTRDFSQGHSSSKNTSLPVPIKCLVASMVFVGGTNIESFCEEAEVNSKKSVNTNNAITDYPDDTESTLLSHLWPDGVQEEDVDALVAKIMNDQSINFKLIPDAIEEQIYKSTIQLTLNILYYLLSRLDGYQVFAHKLEFQRRTEVRTKDQKIGDQSVASTPIFSDRDHATHNVEIDDEVLEQVADQLLANPAINFSMVPDSVERQLYINCIKVIYRVLAVFCSTFSLTVCGHEFRIQIHPAVVERAILSSSSCSFSDVDMVRLKEFAQLCGIKEDAPPKLNWWGSLFVRDEFVSQLHASLYGLILCLVDDVLGKTKIRLFSDELSMDIVPTPSESIKGVELVKETPISSTKKFNSTDAAPIEALFSAPSFAAGLGVGITTGVGVAVTLMSILYGSK